MKRLGAIIAIALVLTIGGVYATFNYAQGLTGDQTATLTKTLGDAETTNAKGTISVNTEDFSIVVDDTNGDLQTETTASGSIKVKFEASQGADAAVRDNGIKLKLVITIEGTNKYGNKDIFTLTDAYTTACNGKGYIVLNDGNEVSGEITVDISGYIAAANNFDLPTLDDYNAFSTAFDATHIKVTVSELEETV